MMQAVANWSHIPSHRLKIQNTNALGSSFKTKNDYEIKNSLLYMDDTKLLYPVGHHIA
jgi:hypothetical protein